MKKQPSPKCNVPKITAPVQTVFLIAALVCNLIFSQNVDAQTVCCLTDSLNISTGWDAVANNLVLPGADCGTPVPDPHWKVCDISASMNTAAATFSGCALTPVALPGNADVVWDIAAASYWVSAKSRWISYCNSNETNRPLAFPAQVTFYREFNLCQAACVTINFELSSDDWINDIHIDGPCGTGGGIYTLFAQPDNSGNLNTYWQYGTDVTFDGCFPLPAGPHTIYVTVKSDISNPGPNGFGLNITGSLITPIPAIKKESDPACAGAPCPYVDVPPVCVGSTVNATYFPSGTTGVWSGGGGNATITSTGVVAGIAAGTDLITYTTSDGCMAIGVVTVNPTPVISDEVVCVGGTVTETATGGVWTTNNGNVSLSGDVTITGESAGTSIITCSIGSCSATATVTVNPTPAVAPITASANPICLGDLVVFNTTVSFPGGTSGLAFTWGGPTITGCFPLPCTTNVFTIPTSTGISHYTLTVSDPLTGCQAAQSIDILVNPQPVITSASVCTNGGTTPGIVTTPTPGGHLDRN